MGKPTPAARPEGGALGPVPAALAALADEPRPGRLLRAAFLAGPFLVRPACYAPITMARGADVAHEMLEAAGACVLGLGTSVILGPAVLNGAALAHLSTWDLVWLVVFLNAGTAFFYAFNLDLLERAPGIGPRLVRERHAAVATLALRPWIRRWATFGVGLFVLSPLPGSGTLGGSIVGRLIGLSRVRSFLVSTLASAAAAMIYGAFGDRLRAWANAHSLSTPVRVAGLLVLLGIAWALWKWVSRMYRGSGPAEASSHKNGPLP